MDRRNGYSNRFAYRGLGHTGYHRGTPTTPTTALPGTEEKIMVLQGSAERGEVLFHPLDSCLDRNTRRRIQSPL